MAIMPKTSKAISQFRNLLAGLLLIFHYGLADTIPDSQPLMVLNLTDAISRALNDNRSLKGAAVELTYSRDALALAESEFNIQINPAGRAGYVGGGHVGAGLSIGGGLDVAKKFQTGTVISVEPSVLKFPDHFHNQIRAMFSQPLLRGLGKEYQLSSIRTAQFNQRTAIRLLYAAQVKLILRTIRSLYEIVKAEKSLFFHHQSYERMRNFYQAALLKEKIGMSDALDIYRAETELRLSKEALANSEERLQDAQDVLRELLSLPFETCFKVEVPLDWTPCRMQIGKAIELALNNRIEMDQEEDQWNENRRLSHVAKKNLLPELNLVLDYSNFGRNEVFTRAWTRHRESSWGIGLTTTASFDPLAEKIAYEQSLSAILQAKRDFEEAESSLVIEVKRVFRQLKRDSHKLLLHEEQIEISRRALEVAKIKFDYGMADNFNLIQAEKTLRGAEENFWGALIDHIIGEYQLLAVTGLLIDKPVFQ